MNKKPQAKSNQNKKKPHNMGTQKLLCPRIFLFFQFLSAHDSDYRIPGWKFNILGSRGKGEWGSLIRSF